MAQRDNKSSRNKLLIAQEAARIMAQEGEFNFQRAKSKAAERLMMPTGRNLPSNEQVEQALRDYQRLFQADEQGDWLLERRQAARAAMELLVSFKPRLTGSVLKGTASRYSDVNLHLFAETSEAVMLFLMECGIPFETLSRPVKYRSERQEEVTVYQFLADEISMDLWVFPLEGVREAPRSAVTGKPMRRASLAELEQLMTDEELEAPLLELGG